MHAGDSGRPAHAQQPRSRPARSQQEANSVEKPDHCGDQRQIPRFPRAAAPGSPKRTHFTKAHPAVMPQVGGGRGSSNGQIERHDSVDTRVPVLDPNWPRMIRWLHNSGESGLQCGQPRRRTITGPPICHAAKACATCSTSTPSYSWRSRCSFSCACAACSASAPAASGRPTIPIRRATPRAARQRQCRGAARPRPPERVAEAGERRRAGRALERHRRERARRSPTGLDAIAGAGPELRRQAFHHRRARGLRDDRRPPSPQGDRRTLKNLLSREVYDGFEAAIRERESKRRDGRDAGSCRSTNAEITGAEVRGNDRAGHRALRLAARSR